MKKHLEVCGNITGINKPDDNLETGKTPDAGNEKYVEILVPLK